MHISNFLIFLFILAFIALSHLPQGNSWTGDVLGGISTIISLVFMVLRTKLLVLHHDANFSTSSLYADLSPPL